MRYFAIIEDITVGKHVGFSLTSSEERRSFLLINLQTGVVLEG
jgi:hypothetical protein